MGDRAEMRTLLALLFTVGVLGQGLRSPGFVAQLMPKGSASPAPDLLWWKCNAGSGTAITGYGTNGGDGGTTDADWVTGKSGSGYALSFNGTNDEAATDSALNVSTGVVTLCAWIKRGSDNNDFPFYYGTTTDGDWFINGTTTWNVYLYGATGYRRESFTLPSTGDWHHYLIVISQTANSGAGDIVVYVDGTLTSTTIWNNTKTGTNDIADNKLEIAWNRATAWWDGDMDDIRLYSGDMSGSVSSIMNDAQ